MRLEPARPLALSRALPLRRLHHVRIREVVKGYVSAVSAGAPEAARAQHTRHRAESRDVLLVVPLVELRLQLGSDVHGVQEQTARGGGRELVAGEYLIALEAHEPLHAARHALGPR